MSTKERIPVDAGMDYFDRSLPKWMVDSHDRDICEYWIDELQAARAKDAELIQQLVDAMNASPDSWWPDQLAALSAANEAGFTPST